MSGPPPLARTGRLPLELRFNAPAKLISLNDRGHHAPRARVIAAWRSRAATTGLAVGRTPSRRRLEPALVAIRLPVRDARDRDPHNYVATLKPVIDGLVDAGLWPDDTPEHVATLEPALDVRRDGIVVVELLPLICPLCAGQHHAATCELGRHALADAEIIEAF